MAGQFRKRAPDAIVVAVDFGPSPSSTGALNNGETVVASNARGSLSVTATDTAGTDISAQRIEGEPWIVAGTQVAFWVVGGAAREVAHLEIIAPTSDGELISERVSLEITI